MEQIQQLKKWEAQVLEADEGASADMDVAKRLLKHGIDTLVEIDALRTANKLAARMEADAHERAIDAYNRAIDDCIKELGVWIYTDGQCIEAIKALKTHNARNEGAEPLLAKLPLD